MPPLSQYIDNAVVERGVWKKVFDSIPDAVIIFDDTGTVVLANKANGDLFGIEGAAHDRLHMAVPLFSASGEPILPQRRPVKRIIDGEVIVNLECYCLTGSGERVDLLVSGGPLTRTEGGRQLYYRICHDVTALRKTEEAERRARLLAEQKAAEWDALFQSLPDAATIFDETGEILEVNKAWLDLLGVNSPADLMATKMPFHTPPDQFRHLDGRVIPIEDRAVTRILRGEEIVNFECCMESPTKGHIDLLLSGGPVRQVEGLPKRFYRISRDITELRRLEKAKTEFMQVVSHEIRNPLQVIKGLIQLMKVRRATETDKVPYLQRLEKQVEELTILVEDILTAYRIGSGRLEVALGQCNLSEIVADSASAYILDQTHQWFVPGPDAECIPVKADPRRLRQVLSNLMSNARKYTPVGRCIWVRTYTEGSSAFVAVEDEGIGIPKDKLDKVFEGFYRAHKPTEWVSGGIGLGLYISRNLARRHGGDLWAEMRPEGGTRLVLSIPLNRPAMEAAPSSSSS